MTSPTARTHNVRDPHAALANMEHGTTDAGAHNTPAADVKTSIACGGGEFTLLPCPFCGAAANLVDNGRSRYMWRYAAQCSGCGVITLGFVTAKEAVTRWNGRVKP
jgi:Lar family restriction alleviation protein